MTLDGSDGDGSCLEAPTLDGSDGCRSRESPLGDVAVGDVDVGDVFATFAN